MTWILDPQDPVVAAWLRGEESPDPAQRCGQRRRRLSEEERQRRMVEHRRKETERQRRRRHARAIAEGREPGVAGTPGHAARDRNSSSQSVTVRHRSVTVTLHCAGGR